MAKKKREWKVTVTWVPYESDEQKYECYIKYLSTFKPTHEICELLHYYNLKFQIERDTNALIKRRNGK